MKLTVEEQLKLQHHIAFTIGDLVVITGIPKAKVQAEVDKLVNQGKVTIADSSIEPQYRWVTGV
jgi:hypothetical protein